MKTFFETPDPKAAWVSAQWQHDRPLISCRFEPTGQYVFCGSEDAVAERFRLSDGVKTVFSGGHTTWIAAFAFSSDGATVVFSHHSPSMRAVTGLMKPRRARKASPAQLAALERGRVSGRVAPDRDIPNQQ